MADASRRLVLLRHGRTAWNHERRAQGHRDVPLDDVGRAQANTVATALAALSPVVVRSSDLRRARQTADPLGAMAGPDVSTDERLREYDLGERTGLTMPEYAASFPDEYAAFRLGRYDVVPGGETTAAVVARCTAALREVLAGLGPGDCAVVVGHGAALKVSLIALLGWPGELAASLRGLDNCGWAEVVQSDERGPLRLTAYNRRADFASRAGVG
jgi:glucosyl-3-phosphoglycerate phosphatase